MYPYWPYWEGRANPLDDADASDVGTVDAALARRVAERLLRPPLLDSGHLVVDVQNGVVILAGRLDSQDACDAASERVWATPGVRDVLNRLTVSPAPFQKKHR
jgi:osmotically-inducible protein OsmY